MNEPRWLTRAAVDIMHQQQLDEHGGSFGIRDANALESAIARARNRFLYDDGVDMAMLAACYAYGIATSHPYTDGNKRTAFVAAAAFLYVNRFDLGRSEAEVVEAFLRLAGGELAEDELAEWFRGALRKM